MYRNLCVTSLDEAVRYNLCQEICSDGKGTVCKRSRGALREDTFTIRQEKILGSRQVTSEAPRWLTNSSKVYHWNCLQSGKSKNGKPGQKRKQ